MSGEVERLQAPMTLVAVLIRVTKGHSIAYDMIHGLVYDGTLHQEDGVKKYAEQLAERQFIKNHLDNKLPQGIIQQYSIVQYGIVQPDEVMLPIGECDPVHARLMVMHMEVLPMFQPPYIDIDFYPDIKEVK